MIKAVIFDLGNVIVSFDHRKISDRLAASCGHASEVVFQKAVASELVGRYNLGELTTAEFCEAVGRELGLEIGYEDFYAAWNCTFLLEPLVPERLVARLAEKHRLLILSDTNEMHFEYIRENFALLRHFDDFVVSHRAGAVKPSPEIFGRAVEAAGCRPEECLFIDDLAANVEGARRCGLDAVQFVSAAELEKELAGRGLL